MHVLGSVMKPEIRKFPSKAGSIDTIKRKIILQLIKSDKLFANEIVPHELISHPMKITEYILSNYDVLIQTNPNYDYSPNIPPAKTLDCYSASPPKISRPKKVY